VEKRKEIVHHVFKMQYAGLKI